MLCNTCNTLHILEALATKESTSYVVFFSWDMGKFGQFSLPIGRPRSSYGHQCQFIKMTSMRNVDILSEIEKILYWKKMLTVWKYSKSWHWTIYIFNKMEKIININGKIFLIFSFILVRKIKTNRGFWKVSNRIISWSLPHPKRPALIHITFKIEIYLKVV